MARDDWRIRIDLDDPHAGSLLDRLGLDLSPTARKLAEELADDRLVVSRADDTVFVYADTQEQALRARAVVDAELAELGFTPLRIAVERWLDEEDRWDDEPRTTTWEEDVLARGHAPWEVRVECADAGAAQRLEDELEAEGLSPVRRWRYVIVGASSREEADELAQRLHGEVEAGGEVVWEVMPSNPFAVFGGLGG